MSPVATSAPAPDLSSAIDAVPTILPDATSEPSSTPEPDAPPALDAPAPDAEPEDADAPLPDAPEDLDPADPLDADKISPDGKTYFFRANKAKALLAARDFHQQIQDAIPNATPESLRGMYDRVAKFDMFLDDLGSGEPDRIGQVAEALAQRSPHSVGMLADQFLGNLAQSQPQAFQQIEAKVTNGIVSRMYADAARTGDESLLKLAQNLDYKQTGKYRSAEQLAQRDPMADDRARFQQERDQFYNERRQTQQQRIDQQVNDAQAEVDASIPDEITKAIPQNVMDAIKAAPGGDIHLRHITRDLKEAVEEARKANPAWQRNYDVAKNRFRANPSAESKAQLVTMMRQFANPVIAKQRNAVITAVTGRILGTNDAAHAKQRQLAARTEPNSSTASTRRPGDISQKLTEIKARGGSMSEAIDAMFK